LSGAPSAPQAPLPASAAPVERAADTAALAGPAPDPAALAERWLAQAVDTLPRLDAVATAGLAWALKHAAYEAWRSDLPRVQRAAALLRALAAQGAEASGSAASAGGSASAAGEVGALADWVDGMAALAAGQMADGAAALARSATAWHALQRPLEAAQTQVSRVMALSMLGRYDEAAACADEALHTFTAAGDRVAAGKISLNLGSLQMRRDDYPAAARHYRQAAVLFARVRDTEHSVMADIGSGDALAAQGVFDEALRLYARARMRSEQHGLPHLSGLADESSALLHLARGAFDTALAGLAQARQTYTRLQMPQPLATAEKQLADAYLQLNLLPEALALYDQCLAAMLALDLPDDAAWTQLARGRTLAALRRGDDAARALADAADRFAQADNAPGAAAVALAQAEHALAAGDAPRAAERAAHAVAAHTACALPEGVLRAQLLQAEAGLRAGQADAARPAFTALLAQAEAQSLQALALRCRSGLGLAALALGDDATAAATLQAAVDQADALWRMLPGDDLRGAFLADQLGPHQGLLALALRAHDRQPGAATATQVLQRLDAVRARALALRLRHGQPADSDPATHDLRTRLHWLQRRVQQQADEGDAAPTLRAALAQAERTLLEHARSQRLLARAQPAAPAAAAHWADDDRLDLAALQALLADDQTIVVHGRHGDELLAGVLRRDGLQLLRRLAPWAEVQAAVRAVRFQLDALRHGVAPVQAHLPMLTQRANHRLQQLHALVWAPLLPALAGTQQVLVVPTAGLAQVPWAALHDGQQPLVQRWRLAQAPSLRIAAWALQRPPAAPRRLLALGDGTRLPHAGREAAAVAAGFADGLALVDAQATVAALQQRSGQADVLHLACHAKFRADNPMFAALQLHDGLFTAEQAERLQLRPATVVLSACDTGLAGEAGGDEQVGLVRAFLLAGAARVVASGWPVDDAVTAALMARFYDALRTGAGPAAALQQAQQQLMATQPHPALWAGFAVHGAW
jgi:CHAT domain-containing protein